MKKISAIIGLMIFCVAAFPVKAAPPAWQGAIDAAIKANNFTQINVIAASNPTAGGEIGLYLLKLSQNAGNGPGVDAKIFEAAAPFAGLIPPGDAAEAASIITAMLGEASNPTFQKDHSHEAAAIFAAALVMSGQPNIVVQDPNLHQEVLTAADDFLKSHPDDADKRLTDEVSLAEAGGAPNNQPLVMPIVSQ
jgi:hypothetical protein